MSEKTVEIEEYIIEQYVPTYGESKMDLLSNAESNLLDASDLITAVMAMVDRGPEDTLLEMAKNSLKDAKSRINACHNELDGEREGIQPVTRN